MLLLTPRKEAEMSQQLSLFETGTATWVGRLWDTIDPENVKRSWGRCGQPRARLQAPAAAASASELTGTWRGFVSWVGASQTGGRRRSHRPNRINGRPDFRPLV
jgi:hypothetical protein